MDHAITLGGFAPGVTGRQRRELARWAGVTDQLGLWDRFISAMSGFSQKAAASSLNYRWGKEDAPLSKPAKVFLALTTVVPTSSSTGVTITEATGAVGYARKEVPVANIKAAVEGETSVIETTAELVFNNIESGEATVIGWALVDSAETNKGNAIMWGTCASTVISATQTPPTVGSGKLRGELK
jgi:hypothetical protein